MHSSRAVDREWGGASSYCNDSSARLARVSLDSVDDTLRFMSVLSSRSFPALPDSLTVWVGSSFGISKCTGFNATKRKLFKSACTEKYTFICERGKSFHPFFAGCIDRSVFSYAE